jgi:23S rRNA (adenine2503-C2)-methyltransferase
MMVALRSAVIMAALFVTLRGRLFSCVATKSVTAFVSSRPFTVPLSAKKKKFDRSSHQLSSTRPKDNELLQSPVIDVSATMEPFKVNLLTLPLPELETIIKSWGYPAFRARQINNWLFNQGVNNIDEMTDLPLKLRTLLKERATIGSLHLEIEQVSNDGTRKRAYKLHDGQMIESVLMPYEDGRRTACISSQAGCAMGCVFCATGQMGFARQLTAEEIFEQVARFANELKADGERLSNVVMMGMGEPLANYRNVVQAIRRMNSDLGIGARKITVSTVGVVPNIRKLLEEDLQVRLAVSLHCATEEERSALLPANRRYGGLHELMMSIKEYIRVKRSRVTFEWALIEGENDSPEVARTLGRLLQTYEIRSDMAHVNLIPLNPTGGFGGGPSGRRNVAKFVEVLEKEFGVSATPRMRRGIDIDAGCGQLKAANEKKKEKETAAAATAAAELSTFIEPRGLPIVGVYEDEIDNDDGYDEPSLKHGSVVQFSIDDSAVDLDDEDSANDFIDPTYDDDFEIAEADRLIALIKGTSLNRPETAPPVNPLPQENIKSTTIIDEDNIRDAKKRRKKLLKNLKAINKLKEMEVNGKVLNTEQLEKIAKEKEWMMELESVEHNLM